MAKKKTTPKKAAKPKAKPQDPMTFTEDKLRTMSYRQLTRHMIQVTKNAQMEGACMDTCVDQIRMSISVLVSLCGPQLIGTSLRALRHSVTMLYQHINAAKKHPYRASAANVEANRIDEMLNDTLG